MAITIVQIAVRKVSSVNNFNVFAFIWASVYVTNQDPDWAAITFGAFVCWDCSGIHRSLGAHISKIKSVQLDDWKDADVQVCVYVVQHSRIQSLVVMISRLCWHSQRFDFADIDLHHSYTLVGRAVYVWWAWHLASYAYNPEYIMSMHCTCQQRFSGWLSAHVRRIPQ